VQYAKSKNVKVLVWAVAQTLERQFEPAFDLYTTLGVAGIKVDFMDADHQTRIRFYEKIAVECMKRKLMVYYHGACKPTGLDRTYPCIINYEGVQANEWNKWSKDQTPKHSVNVAYLRNMAGAMDMNLGPMRNAQGDAFAISNRQPMSQGTRCHQLAMYVVYYGPLQMVGDSPSTYLKEKESMDFIASVPTSWDDSKAIDGTIGEYIVMARRKSDTWFLGAINNETPRTLNVSLNFLGEGKYKAFIYTDGVNAHKVGTDYKFSTREVTRQSSLPVSLATGGGYTVRFEKII
jgi:alpha-glucosidase